jgi:5-hydroxyisourate hydrolase-like protein (transthyretin family)
MKTLEKEGIFEDTSIQGVVILGDGSERPVANVFVTLTDGENNLVELVTDQDGRFELTVTAEQIHKKDYLVFTADSLYESTTRSLEEVGYGKGTYLMTVAVNGPKMPTVSTAEVMSINVEDAVCGGTVLDDGRANILSRGICWGLAHNPSIVNAHQSAPGGVGSFTCLMMGLSPNTTYYVRAYATNSQGTAYGEERTFTTSEGRPLVNTGNLSSITQNSAVCGGNVTYDYGHTVTARGVCWSPASTQPTLNDTHIESGSGLGTFSCNITGLQSGQHYYVRAYAVNDLGIGYGEVKEFTTF